MDVATVTGIWTPIRDPANDHFQGARELRQPLSAGCVEELWAQADARRWWMEIRQRVKEHEASKRSADHGDLLTVSMQSDPSEGDISSRCPTR